MVGHIAKELMRMAADGFFILAFLSYAIFFSGISGSAGSQFILLGFVCITISVVLGGGCRPKTMDERELKAWGYAGWVGVFFLMAYVMAVVLMYEFDPASIQVPLAIMGSAIAFLSAYLASFHALRLLPVFK